MIHIPTMQNGIYSIGELLLSTCSTVTEKLKTYCWLAKMKLTHTDEEILYYASEKGMVSIVKLLLDASVEDAKLMKEALNAGTVSYGMTSMDIVRFMLTFADVLKFMLNELKFHWGDAHATRIKVVWITEEFRELMPDVSVHSCIAKAEENGHTEIVRLLRNHKYTDTKIHWTTTETASGETICSIGYWGF